MNVSLDWLKQADLPQLRALREVCCGVPREKYESLWKFLHEPTTLGLTACHAGGRIVGYLLCDVSYRRQAVALQEFGVLPRYRRHGIARRLLQTIIAKVPHDLAVEARTHERDVTAQLFLKASGFLCIGIEGESRNLYRFRYYHEPHQKPDQVSQEGQGQGADPPRTESKNA
ncbi:MAG: GNAT family N-acetyltransferase [Planctomycetia bacterium]|nr:GNAT family N-acetyltransferase [Planctomycetia bacterium]